MATTIENPSQGSTSSPVIVEDAIPTASTSAAVPVIASTPTASGSTISKATHLNPAGPSTPSTKPVKKKKSSPLSFLLNCLPCISNNKAHSPSDKVLSSTTVRKSQNDSNSSTNEKNSSDLEKSPQKVELENDLPEAIVSEETLTASALAANTTRAGAVLSQEDTEGVTSGAVVPPGKEVGRTRRRRSGKGTDGIITSVAQPGQQYDEDSDGSYEDDEEDDLEEDKEMDLIARGGVGIPIGEDGLPHPLLEPLTAEMKGKKCLVLDLDETLVHSSFKMIHQADYVVPVEIENQYHNVYVIKRPGVDGFLKAMGEIYEVVIFTASLSKYADPVLDQLDIHRVVKHRLFRESCYNNKGNYVKDLSQLGRPISECIIIDNSPASYVFHPNNAVPISSWFNDPHDTELTDLIPFLTDLEKVDDVRAVLDQSI